MQSLRDIHAFMGARKPFNVPVIMQIEPCEIYPRTSKTGSQLSGPSALLILDHFGELLGEGKAPLPAWRSAPSPYGGGMERVAEIDAELRNPNTRPSVKSAPVRKA